MSKDKEYYKERRVRYRKNHFCVWCLKQNAYTLNGRPLCFDCSAKMAKYKRDKWYSTKEATEERKAYRKQLRQKHIDNHECSVCGKKLPDGWIYKQCSRCKAHNAIRQRTENTFMRGHNGLCWLCNKEKCIDGKKLCQKCYDRQLIRQAKATEAAKNKLKHPWKNKPYGRKLYE